MTANIIITGQWYLGSSSCRIS